MLHGASTHSYCCSQVALLAGDRCDERAKTVTEEAMQGKCAMWTRDPVAFEVVTEALGPLSESKSEVRMTATSVRRHWSVTAVQ